MTTLGDGGAHQVDGLITELHENLVTALATHLDLEAGLREVSLPSRYEALVRNIDNNVDLDAGLAAIVGSAASVRSLARRQAPGADVPVGPVVDLVTTLDPAPRVALRAHPVLSTTELAIASRDARVVVEDIDKIIRDFNSPQRRNDTADLSDLPLQLHQVLTRRVHPTRLGVLAAGLEAAGAHLDDYNPALALAANLDNITWNSCAGLLALTGIPGRVRDFAHTTQRIFTRHLDLVLDDLADSRPADALQRALRATPSKDRAPVIVWLRNSLDNMTGVDLRGANLSAVPLDGLRWSHKTCWPREWIDWVEQHSRLAIDNHKDVFVITSGRGPRLDTPSQISAS